jgi:hypothetical protein
MSIQHPYPWKQGPRKNQVVVVDLEDQLGRDQAGDTSKPIQLEELGLVVDDQVIEYKPASSRWHVIAELLLKVPDYRLMNDARIPEEIGIDVG